MYYSLTFEKGAKNTWTDWGLIAASPPMVPPPKPELHLVAIPGRHAGPVDLTRAIFNELTYPRITGKWDFIRLEEDSRTRIEVYEEIRSWLHGRKTQVQTEDDPFHYYQGYFTIEEPKSKPNTCEFSISYDLEPIRYNLDGTEDTTFLQR